MTPAGCLPNFMCATHTCPKMFDSHLSAPSNAWSTQSLCRVSRVKFLRKASFQVVLLHWMVNLPVPPLQATICSSPWSHQDQWRCRSARWAAGQLLRGVAGLSKELLGHSAAHPALKFSLVNLSRVMPVHSSFSGNADWLNEWDDLLQITELL